MIDEEPEHAAETAYQSARAGFELFGEELKPYSPSRKVAAQSMGMLYPFIGESGAAQLAQTGAYAGAMADTVILCWLCSLPDAGAPWTPSAAFRKPALAMEAAMEWADGKEMLAMEGPKFMEAWQVFMAIVQGVEASEFQLHVEGSGGGPESPNV